MQQLPEAVQCIEASGADLCRQPGVVPEQDAVNCVRCGKVLGSTHHRATKKAQRPFRKQRTIRDFPRFGTRKGQKASNCQWIMVPSFPGEATMGLALFGPKAGLPTAMTNSKGGGRPGGGGGGGAQPIGILRKCDQDRQAYCESVGLPVRIKQVPGPRNLKYVCVYHWMQQVQDQSPARQVCNHQWIELVQETEDTLNVWILPTDRAGFLGESRHTQRACLTTALSMFSTESLRERL
jgi:hypothetical protein